MPSDLGRSAGLAALQFMLEEEQYRVLAAEELLGRYLNVRDEQAFAALVRRYGRLVMARCREVLRREDLAQEAFQETFTQLVLNGHLVRRRVAIGRWLARTGRRRALNIARRERRQRARDLGANPRSNVADPRAIVADADTRRILARAMTALPERYRLPMELVYLDGMTHADAANALGCPKGTIDSYVRRGLEKLKRALGPSALPMAAGGTIAVIPSAEAVPPVCVLRAVKSATAIPIPPPPGPFALLAERLKSPPVLAIVAVAGIAVAVGWAQWPAAQSQLKPARVRPASQLIVESLPEQNLRLLRGEIAPKMCDALKGLTADRKPPAIIETDSYDSRVRILIEGCFNTRLPDVGEKSRSMFYFDTGRRRTYLYMDRKNDGNWKPIDLDKPIILAKFPAAKVEWTQRIPEVTAAIKVFDEFPHDPRAVAEVEKRLLALRQHLRVYVGNWYRDGDPKQPRRVELLEPLGLAFYQGTETEPARVVTEEEIWACEARSRAWPINSDGLLGCIRIALEDNGQTMHCWPMKGLWKRGRE